MYRKYLILVIIVGYLILLNTAICAVNKIAVKGIVQNIDGEQLVDAQLTMKRQKISATTNRFGEFDLGKVFPNDTLLVVMDGYQYQYIIPKSDMQITLYPKSVIQDKINGARNGDTIIIPSGAHYIYPDFNIDSTVGMTINYKTDITIVGENDTEIWLKSNSADIIYIYESNNITIKNISIGYYNSLNNIEEIISFDDAKTFGNAFSMARRQLGKNSIFKYKGKLYHTNNPNEPSDRIIPGKAINIFNSSDIFIDSVNIYGKNNICLNANSSKNINFNNSGVNEGVYGFVLNKCENVKIENSTISDNSEILFNQKAQVNLNENIIKIAGNYVPEFVLVEGGSIELLDESIIPPPKPKYLESGTFSISRKEITFDQYDAFCKATNRLFPDDSEWGRGKRPVINITYDDALSYCSWLSSLLGKTIRLPNLNEWEYAARGGLKGGDDKFYSGGNVLEDVAWCKYNTKNKSEPVGLKVPNELGIYDMSGNVYEFCNGVNDSMIVLKGGSWANSGVGCRVSDKVVSKIDFWDDNIGFRVVEGELEIKPIEYGCMGSELSVYGPDNVIYSEGSSTFYLSSTEWVTIDVRKDGSIYYKFGSKENNDDLKSDKYYKDDKWTLLLPPKKYSCNQNVCYTPDMRGEFTNDGKFAITTLSKIGGPTLIWELKNNNFIDVTKDYVSQYELGGWFKISPNGNYVSFLGYDQTVGLSLSILDLDTKEFKIIGGSILDKDKNKNNGLSFNRLRDREEWKWNANRNELELTFYENKRNKNWLDDYLLTKIDISDENWKQYYWFSGDNEHFFISNDLTVVQGFGFTNDNRTLFISGDDGYDGLKFIFYDIFSGSIYDGINCESPGM